jgi:pyruvate,water dikinase
MNFILWPEDITPELPLGGKIMGLWSLRTSGLEVPAWFAVAPTAFEHSLPGIELLRPATEESEDDFLHRLESLIPVPLVTAELKQALARLCPNGELVAVRSSARDEDGASASFAGQFESFLGVRPIDVPAAVAAVWRSCFSERVRAYRMQQGLLPDQGAPAVLIQRMVRADASGVAFGADPVSGTRDRRVIAAVPGLAQGLVAGETDADTWHLDLSGTVLERHLTVKTDAWRLTPDGLRREALDPETSAAPALNDRQLATVMAAAETTGRHFGLPQDIEWAFEHDRFWLLQSRPITTLEARVADDQPFAIWDNSNIVESYSGVTTPLTFSFAQRAYEGVYRQFCRMLAVPSLRIEVSDAVFRNMLGLHHGRIYYNLLNWYRVLAMLPGFTVNRRFMEQMMGVKEPMPDAIVAGLANAGLGARIKDAFNLALSVGALVVHQWRLPSAIRRFRARLEDALRPPSVAWENQSAGALAAAFLDLEQRLLRRWDAPLINDFLTMIFYGVLREVTAKWSGDATGMLHNDLLCDSGGMVSAEPARRIADLARLATAEPGLPPMLSQGSRPVIERTIDRLPALRAARDAYLADFGDRCFDELKLESPVLTDDPLPLYRAIGRVASMPLREITTHEAAASPAPRAAAETRMAAALAGRPIRRLLYRWILHHARSGVRERENLRLERTRLFGRVRRIFLALGQRLQEMGALDHPRDVIWLEVDEILRFVSGAASSVRLRDLAAVRRNEFEAYRQASALPNRFTTQGVPSRHLPAAPQNAAPSTTSTSATNSAADVRSGIGCCPGLVRGRVCRVTDPNQSNVRTGEILVAERTDPGWIMLFPGAAGLLVERGSLLSHSAIVARELRLPAVVSIHGLMDWLCDGDFVEFDGSSGVVRKLPDPVPNPHAPPLIHSIPPAE